MTKKELLEELKDVPEGAVICGYSEFDDMYYEIHSIEHYMEEEYDVDDGDVKKGEIVVI